MQNSLLAKKENNIEEVYEKYKDENLLLKLDIIIYDNVIEKAGAGGRCAFFEPVDVEDEQSPKEIYVEFDGFGWIKSFDAEEFIKYFA